MNKILIEVYVPTIEKKYDILLPINKKIKSVIILLSKAVKELNDGAYIIKTNSLLCDKAKGMIYNPEAIVKESGLKNGSEVLLI